MILPTTPFSGFLHNARFSLMHRALERDMLQVFPSAAHLSTRTRRLGLAELKEKTKDSEQDQRKAEGNTPEAQKPVSRDKLLVVGLGNPGKEYEMTRHNIGFLVAEELARRQMTQFRSKTAFKGEYASFSLGGKSIGLLRPSTYMNLSGESVKKVGGYFGVPPCNVLVVLDEVNLEFGQVRLRKKGSAGGHNGLKSIEKHLGTRDYPRLRIGVGANATSRKTLADYVLEEFSRIQLKELKYLIADSVDVIEHWIKEDNTDKVMSSCNST
eukprot:CAMPEP_0113938206 /NCGR_PEP_ID=MMETSP1339-20121228/4618_1 /TAXON_ID=94617 /ORGANISM="Fibrocapsa japonica" /LENGTH=268 /DNA_ID=CAMNT_0000941203 /DNA_START=17 /DNA_END=823 /DNA_ORIENTATION=+ /assembly_acc=CAM_ASM_000762